MSAQRRRSRIGRALPLYAAVGGAAVGIALQRRHARTVASHPDYAELMAPLGGRARSITSADGTQIHAEVFGAETGRTVVLAHGWTEQLSYWGPVIRLLSDRGLRPVAYDLRGHGRSGRAVDGDYSLTRFGEDVEAVLAAVTPSGERATLVGHSLGAMSIAAWAERHDPQERALAAALVNTGLGDLIGGHLLFGELTRYLNYPAAGRAFLGSRAPIPSFSSPIQIAMIRHAAFGPTATTGQVAFYEQMLISCPPEVRAAAGVALSEMDLWHAVARLTVPTLVIAGDVDRLTPPAHARRIAETLPRPAGLIVLPRTGHMAPLERPAEIAAALAGLVSEAADLVEV